jgi:DNA topoisomerase-2
LGLQQGKEYKDVSELRYGRLMIMTDADKSNQVVLYGF